MPKCDVHNIELSEGTISITYGLHRSSELHKRAQKALFPNANSFISCGCIQYSTSPIETSGVYCARCRDAEEEWNRRPNPLAGINVEEKEDVLAALDNASTELTRQIARAAEALFPFALEVAKAQQRLNLLAHKHGVIDDDYFSKRVDVLLDETTRKCEGSLGRTFWAIKRAHHDQVFGPGWAEGSER